MQVKNFLVAALASSFVLLSCSKKSEDKPASTIPIEGSWIGKFSVLSEPFNNFYSFKIKPGGVLEVQDAAQQKTGSGSWKLEGNLFMATYTNTVPDTKTFSVLATFNKHTGKLDGTWGPDDNDYTGGYWFMNRSN